jgi:hypothetical protein
MKTGTNFTSIIAMFPFLVHIAMENQMFWENLPRPTEQELSAYTTVEISS